MTQPLSITQRSELKWGVIKYTNDPHMNPIIPGNNNKPNQKWSEFDLMEQTYLIYLKSISMIIYTWLYLHYTYFKFLIKRSFLALVYYTSFTLTF